METYNFAYIFKPDRQTIYRKQFTVSLNFTEFTSEFLENLRGTVCLPQDPTHVDLFIIW